ncbi:MAG: T9SS type B sorting domain-containing protein, partial [Sphingobacteriales bacterium]
SISPASASICEGGTIVLTGTGGTSYEWMLNGVKIQNQTSSTLTASAPGTYSVTIINGTCTGPASNTTVVSILETPGVRYTEITAKENTPIRLSARNIGSQWEWTPATGLDDPSSIAPLATLIKDQLYFINITNEQNCSITDTLFVKVIPAIPNNNSTGKVGVPTAFTPNSNNVNDQLRPLGNLRKLDYFRVYNRWGVLVFQTNKIGEGWDGRHKGTMQTADTFSWILMGESTDGQPIKLSGKTVLIR